jgi:hypothetical protein
MEHASELIRQIIRKQNLHAIYPGQEESAFGDLVQTAWVQIEKTLYKFRARPHCRACFTFERPGESALYTPGDYEYGILSYEEIFAFLNYGYDAVPNGIGSLSKKKHRNHKKAKCPHCDAALTTEGDVLPEQNIYGGTNSILFRGFSKVFNMWSQVARTVILAYIKKEGRDKKNSPSYRDHITGKHNTSVDRLDRFFSEAGDVCKYNNEFSVCLEALQDLAKEDPRPYDGLIGKLAAKTGFSRPQINLFMGMLRIRSSEFSDAPMNYNREVTSIYS